MLPVPIWKSTYVGNSTPLVCPRTHKNSFSATLNYLTGFFHWIRKNFGVLRPGAAVRLRSPMLASRRELPTFGQGTQGMTLKMKGSHLYPPWSLATGQMEHIRRGIVFECLRWDVDSDVGLGTSQMPQHRRESRFPSIQAMAKREMGSMMMACSGGLMIIFIAFDSGCIFLFDQSWWSQITNKSVPYQVYTRYYSHCSFWLCYCRFEDYLSE